MEPKNQFSPFEDDFLKKEKQETNKIYPKNLLINTPVKHSYDHYGLIDCVNYKKLTKKKIGICLLLLFFT